MAERRPLIAANWKMNLTTGEAREFCAEFLPFLAEGINDGVDVTICPPFTLLAQLVEECEDTRAQVAAQNMHFEDSGAFTGEVSGPMLADLGVDAVVLGHSERRQLFGEHDHALAKKVKAALAAGLTPILCVGETDAEREAGAAENILRRQIQGDLDKIGDEQLGDVVIAYEPVWAIGTGKTATAEQANDACGFIRSLVADRNPEAAAGLRIQYGGSVKPGNAEELLGQSDIDGALVGGAALNAEDFAAIVAAAR